MVAAVTYYKARQAAAEAKINFASDIFAVVLTNRAPVQATDEFLSDISELAPGNGYPTGGIVLQRTSSALAGGVYKTVFADPPVFQASGGAFPAARYVVVVDQSTGGSPLAPSAVRVLGYYDYGASFTLQDGETFAPDLDQLNGLLQMTAAA